MTIAPRVPACNEAPERASASCEGRDSRTVEELQGRERQVSARVGRFGAHDRTSGVPVRNVKHSNRLYATAMHYNRGLDRDGDKIACEKR